MSYFSVSLPAKLDFTVLSNSNYVWCVPKGKGGYLVIIPRHGMV